MVPSTLVKKDNTLHPAGGHYASVEALSKWLLIHMNEGEYQGKHIYDAATVRLSKSALAKTEEDTKSQEPYSIEATGLGWRIGKYNDEEIVYMSGSFAGFYAHIAYKPGEKTGVVALANELLIGSRYCNMLAAYVFDWFHYDGAQVEQYAQQLQQFDKIVGGMSGRIKQMYRKINEREWQLELDKEAYTGKYISDAYGELQIVLHKGEFKVTFGNFSTNLTAYEKKNTARVEFFPFHGELIRFKIENEEVMALTIGDSAYEMKKVK
jgi:hypothetical protein